MTNTRRRKDRKEFERGYRAGTCNRQPEGNEYRVAYGPFYEGFAKGRLELLNATHAATERERQRIENAPRIAVGQKQSA